MQGENIITRLSSVQVKRDCFLTIFVWMILFMIVALPVTLAAAEGIWGMGNSSYGELGIFPQDEYVTPQEILADNGSKVEASFAFSLFTKSDGSLWSMGDNWDGALGTGDTDSRDTPYQVTPSDVVDVAGGHYHMVKSALQMICRPVKLGLISVYDWKELTISSAHSSISPVCKSRQPSRSIPQVLSWPEN